MPRGFGDNSERPHTDGGVCDPEVEFRWDKDHPVKTLMVLFIVFLFETMSHAQICESGPNMIRSDSLDRAIALRQSGDYRAAIEAYETLLGQKEVAEIVEYRAYLLSEIAEAHWELGENARAEARAREALSRLTACGITNTSAFARTEGLLASALGQQGKLAEARERVRHALQIGESMPGPARHRTLGLLLLEAASVDYEAGDLRRTERQVRRAIAILEEEKGADQTDLGTAYNALAEVLSKRGRHKESLDAADLALSKWKTSLPPDHPLLVYGLNTKIIAHEKLKEFRKAEKMIPEMLRLCLLHFRPDHPNRIVVLQNAGAVYFGLGKYEEAEYLLKEGVAVGRQYLPAGHPALRQTLRIYSQVLLRLHRPQEAAQARAESELISVTSLSKVRP